MHVPRTEDDTGGSMHTVQRPPWPPLPRNGYLAPLEGVAYFPVFLCTGDPCPQPFVRHVARKLFHPKVVKWYCWYFGHSTRVHVYAALREHSDTTESIFQLLC